MPNYELHNQLKQLSGYVYKNSEFKKPNNWMVVDSTESRKSGFYSETFMNGNNIVIAFRGTDIKRGKKELTKDMYSNACMGLSLPPSQIINAQSYYEKIKRKYPNSNIILTGHSLGGSLAQILGSEYGNQTVTFNAYGTANLLKTQIKYSDNIINYGNEDDIVFSSNVKNQIGNTYIISNSKKGTDSVYSHKGYNKNASINNYHGLSDMGDISKAVPYNGENLQTNGSQLFKANLEKNVDYRDIDPKRILTNEEIKAMSNDEFEKNEEFINQKIKEKKIMTKAQADEQVKLGNLIWVNPYKKDDGTEVRGYYRAR